MVTTMEALFPLADAGAPVGVHAGWIPRILTVDSSLASTGVSVIDSAGAVMLGRIRTEPATRWKKGEKHPIDYPDLARRIRTVVDGVRDWASGVDVAGIETPAYTRGEYGSHEGAGVWWAVYGLLAITLGIPVVPISPQHRMQYATGVGRVTGKGRERKRPVMEAMQRRHPALDLTQPDKVDAFVLGAMVRDWWGAPLAPVPPVCRAALSEVQWPELPLPTTPIPIQQGAPC